MKKVLIALDYGPSAQKVAETGYELAKSMNARTILLHVISDATHYSSVNYPGIMGFDSFNNLDLYQPEVIIELKKAAKEYLDNTKQHLGDETIETALKEGDFADSILETAMEKSVDIIVMGTHSRRGLDKILMGSVAEKVMHHSSIPLFIIPVKKHEEENNKSNA
jgi:nucleotide-binding universal stress UspA family protein